MKAIAFGTKAAFCLSVLAATIMQVPAAGDAMFAKPDSNQPTYTGTVTAVSPQDGELSVRGWRLFSRKFHAADNGSSLNGLRPGQKVSVAYHDADGTLIADRVEPVAMRREGVIRAISPSGYSLTLNLGSFNQEFALLEETRIRQRDGSDGKLASLKPGDHVSVLFETPGPRPVAREISKTSETFAGVVTAISPLGDTLSVRNLGDTKKFQVSQAGTVALDDRNDAKLDQLKPGEHVMVSYDRINGVNLVNRITTGLPDTRPVMSPEM